MKRTKVIFLENYYEFRKDMVCSLFEDYAKRLELVKTIEFCNCLNCKYGGSRGCKRRLYGDKQLFAECKNYEHWEKKTKIEDLGISPRTYNCLKKIGITLED